MKKIILLTFIITQVIFGQNPPQWIIYNTSNSPLPSNNIRHIVVDNMNRKWISLLGFGLLKIDNTEWVFYNTTNSNIPSNSLFSINVDNSSNFWAGGFGGNFRLTKFDGFNWTVWNSTNSPIPDGYVMSLIFDNENDLWLLGLDGSTFGPNHLLELTHDSVWNIHVSFNSIVGYKQMMFDENEILWIGESHGLFKYNGDTLIYIQWHPGQYVTDIKQDSLGNLWLATGLAGWGCLVKYDGVSFTSFSNIQAISIEIDSSGNVWVGTGSEFSTEAELLKYDGNDWTIYNSTNSQLPSSYQINDLAFDSYGNLWIATENAGLVIFNENGIVPVELISFSATVTENNVTLNWITVTETNNQGFEVQKKINSQQSSVGNGDWVIVGFVEGYGTTTEPKSYSFIDENLQAGKYQYRLKQIDFDGSFEYSNIIEVEVGLPEQFVLFQNYPNPFNPTTKIKFSIPSVIANEMKQSQKVTLKIFNILGKEIATLVNEEKQPGIYEVEFDGSNLSSGIYFYQLQAGDFILTKKLILIK